MHFASSSSGIEDILLGRDKYTDSPRTTSVPLRQFVLSCGLIPIFRAGCSKCCEVTESKVHHLGRSVTLQFCRPDGIVFQAAVLGTLREDVQLSERQAVGSKSSRRSKYQLLPTYLCSRIGSLQSFNALVFLELSSQNAAFDKTIRGKHRTATSLPRSLGIDNRQLMSSWQKH